MDRSTRGVDTQTRGSRTLNPKIELFNPFKKPFSQNDAASRVVDPEVVEYMRGEGAKVVAKCTPCQCCACR